MGNYTGSVAKFAPRRALMCLKYEKAMIASMTAFGSLEDSGDWGRLGWELRTVNHRYLEISVRLPEELRMLEHSVREQIAARLGRGKVDCMLRYAPHEKTSNQLNINTALANTLIAAAESLPISGPSSLNPVDVLRWPGMIKEEAIDLEMLSRPLLRSLDAALDVLIKARRREGKKLRTMIVERCSAAGLHVDALRARLPQLTEGLSARYLQRAREMKLELDQARLEQELLLLVQKMDVAEELDRLQAHIDEVEQLLDESKPVGRHLDFLLQEMHREANTLGAKLSHIEGSKAAVALKVLIEQMREQVQNIE